MNTKELSIIRIGDPRLLIRSSEVPSTEISSEETKQLVKSMLSFLDPSTCVGLAAPQLGINKRILVFGMPKHPTKSNIEEIPETVLINPEITFLSDEVEIGYEGCMSAEDIRIKVPRSKHIEYKGTNIEGEEIIRKASGFHARLVQHEYDHLEGILFIERSTELRSIGFNEELSTAGAFNQKM